MDGLFALALVTALAWCLRKALGRFRDSDAETRAAARGPALLVAAGVLVGAGFIGFTAFRGIHDWQSIPSTWDAVWHANTIRFILDTGQASPTHMGELRNIETHEALYYPSTFHALALGAEPGHRSRTDHGLHAQLAGRGDLAVPRQRRDADVASAAHAHRRMAQRGRGGDRSGDLGVVHRDPLRRVRHRVDAESDVVRPGRSDHGVGRLRAAAPRPYPGGRAGPARSVLGPPDRRCGHRPVRDDVVAGRCALAPGAGPTRGSRHPAVDRDSDCGAAASTVRRCPAAGRDHRRACLRHARGQEACALRRGGAAHPSPQRLSDPVDADRPCRRRRGHPAGQADLVAAGGVAAAGGGDRALVGPVRWPARRDHRKIQRPVLQRSAATVGGGGSAPGGVGRHRFVHDRVEHRDAGGRPRQPAAPERGTRRPR